MSIHLRPAVVEDAPVILGFIRELAAYEKLSEWCVATEEDLAKHLFGAYPKAEAILAEWDGRPVGFALFFYNFSTFLAKPGIYLEDLYIQPEMRGKGIGKALLMHLVRLAKLRDCGRVEWSVLDWNAPSIEFYKSVGAVAQDDWTIYRLTV